MTPLCTTCGQPTACHDPENDARPLCAECNVKRHERRRDRAAFPTTVRSTNGKESFSVATTADGWGLSFDFRELDADAKPPAPLAFEARTKRRKP